MTKNRRALKTQSNIYDGNIILGCIILYLRIHYINLLHVTTNYNTNTFSYQSQVKDNNENNKKEINTINNQVKIEKDCSFKSSR